MKTRRLLPKFLVNSELKIVSCPRWSLMYLLRTATGISRFSLDAILNLPKVLLSGLFEKKYSIFAKFQRVREFFYLWGEKFICVKKILFKFSNFSLKKKEADRTSFLEKVEKNLRIFFFQFNNSKRLSQKKCTI